MTSQPEGSTEVVAQGERTVASLVELMRSIAREEACGSDVDVAALKAEILTELRESAQDDRQPQRSEDIVRACADCAEEIFADEEWRKQVNGLIQDAFQGVLPSLLKRIRAEMDKAVAASGGGGGTSADLLNSSELKEMLDERFRTMVLYLKQEVIPKAVQQA